MLRITVEWRDSQFREFFKGPEFISAFNKHFSQQVIGFISRTKATLQHQMDSGSYPQLGITQYIALAGQKPANKVLRDTERFRNSLKGHYVRDSEYLTGVDFAFEGVSSKGLPFSRLAVILEEGRDWTPTNRERNKIAMDASNVGAPEPEGPPKLQWRIPSRPFIRDTFTKDDLIIDFLMRTTRALELAIRQRASAGR